MSNLEKWIKAILNEDSENLSIGSVRTLQIIKHEFEAREKSLAEKDKEIEQLKAWKESAMSVMSPIPEIGKALGIRLGESIHDKILPGIERLKEDVEKFKSLYELAKINQL